jgi:ProP effector
MSHKGIDKLAGLFPHCFFRRSHLRRPLKLGIHEDIIAQHPELDRTLIGRGLNAYTHSTTYWLTLSAGTPRINLDGNLAGEVTLKEEEHAKRKIVQAVRRAVAKAPGQPAAGPVEKCAEQQNSTLDAKTQQVTPAGPPRLGLAGLKAAAQARRAMLVDAK